MADVIDLTVSSDLEEEVVDTRDDFDCKFEWEGDDRPAVKEEPPLVDVTTDTDSDCESEWEGICRRDLVAEEGAESDGQIISVKEQPYVDIARDSDSSSELEFENSCTRFALLIAMYVHCSILLYIH